MADDKKEKQEKAKKPKPEGQGKGDGAHGKGDGKGGGQKKDRKPKGPALQEMEVETDAPKAPAPPARLFIHYKEKIVPALSQQFGFKNAFAVPRLEKIVLSMGLGRFATSGGEGKGNFEKAERELTVIAGQKPVRTLAKKSVANFKVREGMETGLKVTLRGGRMYEFLDRLIALAIPRVKDFRGLDPNGFDKSGNYNMGFGEQTIFPEVNSAEVTFQQGLNITMVTTAGNVEHGRELLKQFGFPFREHSKIEGR
ncbi:MAG: 50S ribosomal protein L5 [Tepidisphaeraceae bacterium]|jgi:large subunit ribosomal protein L5